MAIDEKSLTKGEIRKLNALRKSIGDELAEDAFSKWLKRRVSAKVQPKEDPVAIKIEQAIRPLLRDKKLNLGRHGYSIRRAKGRGVKPGFVVTRVEKSS